MASGSADLDEECRQMFMIYVEKITGKKDGNAPTSAMKKMLKDLNIDHLSTFVDSSLFPTCQNAAKKLEIKVFMTKFLPGIANKLAEKKGTPDEHLADLKQKLSHRHQELLHPDKQKNAAVVDRLTDTKGYTGSHKERFDSEGKGKGMDGRVDKQDGSGYVGAYKGAETYDKNTLKESVVPR